MTLREGMIEAASRAPRLLGDSRHAVATFLRAQQNPDGGFRGRADHSDLYYTVFAVEGLVALGEPPDPDPVRRYLASFGDGEGLDFIHLACLARCWADVAGLTPDIRATLIRRVEGHRSADGGYGPTPGAEHGTAYGCFFALGALEDLNLPRVPNLREVMGCLFALQRDDGGYANERPLRSGTTPATAAAVSVIKQLGGTVDPATAEWLLQRAMPDGGFIATDVTPLPDLLSTATALHALSDLSDLPADLRQACLAFVQGLRTDAGGYLGLWLDEEPDAEYTFYALLALGHLSGFA